MKHALPSARFLALGLVAVAISMTPPLGAQTVGPASPAPAPAPQRDCEGDPNSRTDVVVCGRRRGESPYRLPRQFRERPDEGGTSTGVQARDAIEVERYGAQAVGPGGALQRSRQTDCQWRAERQQLRGEQIDCSRSVRPAWVD
jgi:hypothetical protein